MAQVNRAIGIFQTVVSGFGVPEDDSIHAIRVVRAGLHGFADIQIRGGFQMAQSTDRSFDMLVDALETSLWNLARARRTEAG